MNTTSPFAAAGFFFGAASAALAQPCGTLWMQEPVSVAPSPRSGAAMATDTLRERIIIFGGRPGPSTPTTFSNQTWSWQRPATGASGEWTLLTDAGPSARTNSVIAYDSARDRIVLFGGEAFAVHGDTWEWDGNAWHLKTAVGPPASLPGAMTFDPVRAKTIYLHNGGPYLHNNLVPEIWEWDGDQWHKWPAPPPTIGFDSSVSIEFNPLSQRLMLLGEGRTWEHDGQSWLPLTLERLSPRGRLIFDHGENQMVCIGAGMSVYRWNPASQNWLSIAGSVSPRRDHFGLAFDPRASGSTHGGRILTFSGAVVNTYFPETWSLNSTANGGPSVELLPYYHSITNGSRVELAVVASGTGTLTYQWRRNNIPLVNGGAISGANSPTLVIDPFSNADNGSYGVKIDDDCGANFAGTLAEVFCYANCDGSTTPPYLNVDDFTCFINLFADGSGRAHAVQIIHYNNCDNSTTAPVLNVDDFICFINAFAAGCP